MPLSGIVFVGLIVASIVVAPNLPGANASAAKIVAFYGSHRTSHHVSALLSVIAVVVGVFFFGVLRSHLRRAEGNEQFASIAFGGALIFGASGALSAGVRYSLADVPTRLNAGAAQALNVLQNDLSFAMMTAGISVLMLASATAILRSQLMPHWVGWSSVVIGVVALAGPLGFFAFLATGPWVLVVSVLLYRADSQQAVITLPSIPTQTVPADTRSKTRQS